MAPPTLSQYIRKQGEQLKNIQKLLGYYGELYQYYSEFGLPDNKYIYFLEENTFKMPFSTLPPDTSNFLSLRPDELTLLTPYIRLYKKFRGKSSKIGIHEFPFENRTDFSSFNDPQSYLGNDMPFVTPRFNGPIAYLKTLSINYDGHKRKGASAADSNAVTVQLSMFLQDAKLLFKNWGSIDNQLQYKDLFAQQSGNNQYEILIELGYNVPDGYEKLQNIASRKLLLSVQPLSPTTNFDYDEQGQLNLSVTLRGRSNLLENGINMLDSKYYKQVKKKNNMIVLQDDEDVSVKKYEEELNQLIKEKNDTTKSLKNSADATSLQDIKNKKSLIKKSESLEKRIQSRAKLVQLAKNIGANPESFSFITALYEAGLIYYFELDNEVYKNYIQKIAAGVPVDVSNLNLIPKRKQKLKLSGEDSLNKNFSRSTYFANTLKLKRLNYDEPDESNLEKIKFFYFGDLVNIILNDSNGTGVGQDLDRLGRNALRYLFGNVTWIKDENTKIVYNILNTPISLDMFLFELNREIYQYNKKRMSIDEFFVDFMKRFFDTMILSTEKQKSGKEQQYYSAKDEFTFDRNKFTSGSKFKEKLYNFLPIDTDTIGVRLISCFPTDYDNITNKTRKKRNIPNIYIGGPDKGPISKVSINVTNVRGLAEVASERNVKVNSYSDENISEVIDSSLLVHGRSSVQITSKGNMFFNLGDYVFVDTRFVDGGYFQEEGNTIFLTGNYQIISINHDFDGSSWVTNYKAILIPTPNTKQNKDYKAFSGELPTTQTVDISDQANINRQGIIKQDTSKMSVSSKTSIVDSSESSGAAGGTAMANTTPPSVSKTK